MAHVERLPRRATQAPPHEQAGASARAAAWWARRHSLRLEVALVLGLYAVYELLRDLVVAHRSIAVAHAHDVAALERHLHVFVEPDVQRLARDVPGLIGVLGFLYLTLHLSVTVAYLLWLHHYRPQQFPVVRNVLLVASGLSLVGFLAYPTAPPRDAGIGIADTISNGHVDLNKGLVASLYNPYAAIPSMHFGYALVIGISLIRTGRRRLAMIAGALYPLLILGVIVATGNHFLIDAALGALTVGVAAGLVWLSARATTSGRRELAAPHATTWTPARA
jgi:PAP2 superfamily protein